MSGVGLPKYAQQDSAYLTGQSSRVGKPDSMSESTCESGQVGSRTAEKKSPDLSRHQTFRLTDEEKTRLYSLAESRGVKVSTLLRSLVQKEVLDVE